MSIKRRLINGLCCNFKKNYAMNDRPNDLLRIRPEIKKTNHYSTTSEEEQFQNTTLRPILKLQNPLFLVVFKNYIKKRKGVFNTLSLPKRLIYIENALFRDQKLRNSIKGMIIGMFTVEEYINYSSNSSSLNKRMMTMVSERLKDQVQFFD